MSARIKSIKLELIDLDGTLYVGEEVIPGAPAALAQLRTQGYMLRFLTNTTTRSQTELLTQLRNLGFILEDNELIRAPAAAWLELASMQTAEGKALRIWTVVADAIKEDFNQFFIDDQQPDFIVLGDIGAQWNLELINRLFNAMHAGAKLIALHKNRFWQTEDGLKADIGFFVAGLEYVTSQTAQIMGKPTPAFFQRVLNSAGVEVADSVLVGDDIDSDVGGAQAVGIKGVLVKTGKFRQSYLEKSQVKPDGILNSLADFPEWLNTQVNKH
jgi:HAD superfamily hydrolase (TIGR01458 family)